MDYDTRLVGSCVWSGFGIKWLELNCECFGGMHIEK